VIIFIAFCSHAVVHSTFFVAICITFYAGREFSEATKTVHEAAGWRNGLEILQLRDPWSKLCNATVRRAG